jgi:uncharacterized protein YndB with AHSA1/START domain
MKQRPTPAAVRLERSISASPHEVYRAWLDPDILRRWFTPGGLQVKRAEIEERVGGRYCVWQASADADMGGFDCEIVELIPDQKIVFRWGFVGPMRTNGPKFDSLLTITLRSGLGNTTVLTLVHERLEDLAGAMPQVADKVELGWQLVLDKLQATVTVARS